MKDLEDGKNGLFDSQKVLFGKLKKICPNILKLLFFIHQIR